MIRDPTAEESLNRPTSQRRKQSLPGSVPDIGACRLLFLAPQLGVGGLERQLFGFLMSVDRDRYSPCVVVWNYDEDERYASELRALGVPVVGLAESSRWAKLRALRRLIVELQPEIVHSYSFYANAVVAYACRNTPALAIGSMRGDFDYDLANSGPLLGRLSARFPPHQICNSWRAAENVRRTAGAFVPRYLQVVPNGVDLTAFAPRLRPRSRPVTVAGVGSLIELKNWTVLLPLAARWAAEGIDVRVRIAGDGPLRGELAAEIDRLGIAPWFELVGQVDDVAGFLGQADLFVHVSTSEGMPNVVLEAMAAGRPVVAFDSGDMRRLVDDGVSGYVVPLGAANELDARLRLLFADEAGRDRMGRAARQKAEAFSLSGLADRVLSAYSSFGWQGAGRQARGAHRW